MISRMFVGVLLLLSVTGTGAQQNSLFSESTFRPLVSDHRAFKLGDLLTVVIQETNSASTTVDSGTQKRSEAGIQVDPVQGSGVGAGVGISNETQGGGRIQRSGRLLGHISVTVKGLAENGDLLVEGQQFVDINGELQTIKLAGRVRQRDVDASNTVPSSRVADARITFSGDGFLAEKGRPGWWDQLLGFFGL